MGKYDAVSIGPAESCARGWALPKELFLAQTKLKLLIILYAMSSVYFPAQVVVLIRRLVNVVSTLSLSNQYLLQRAKREEFLTGGNQTSCPTERTSGVSSWSSRSPDMSEWPWWMSKDNWEWSRTRHVDHYSSQSIELLSNAPGVQGKSLQTLLRASYL